MYIQHTIEMIYVALITVYILFIVGFIYLTSRSKVSFDGGHAAKGMEKREKLWLATLLIVAITCNAILLSPILPSMAYQAYLDKKPVKTVVIYIEDHSFKLPEHPIKIKAGEPVEFIVYSKDLTYGFGVFRADGTMVFQMQVVPNYRNRIVWVFDEPGVYTIRSTEYSGPEHPYMVIYNAIVVYGGD